MELPHLTVRLSGYGPKLNPARDWLILVAVLLLLVFVSTAVQTYFFSRVAGEPSSVIGTGKENPGLFDRSGLEEVFDLFKMRAEMAGKYQRGDLRFIDPSK